MHGAKPTLRLQIQATRPFNSCRLNRPFNRRCSGANVYASAVTRNAARSCVNSDLRCIHEFDGFAKGPAIASTLHILHITFHMHIKHIKPEHIILHIHDIVLHRTYTVTPAETYEYTVRRRTVISYVILCCLPASAIEATLCSSGPCCHWQRPSPWPAVPMGPASCSSALLNSLY